MKLTVERAPLLAALQRAKRTVERRNTIPILSNLLLRPGAGELTVTATDLDIEMVEIIKAEGALPGEGITVPAHTLADIVAKLPDGAQVQIEVSGDRGEATIRAGRSRFKLQTLPAHEFPDLAEVKDGVRLSIVGSLLADAIARVEFAISTEETRYYLNGIYLHATAPPTKLRLVATDGHRLSLATLDCPTNIPGVIVPRKAVAELKRMAEAADKAEVALEVSSSKLAASFNGARFTTKLIDGTYPDYGRVIPLGNAKVAALQAEDLAAAADRVGTVASERGRAVKLTFSDAGLALDVTNPDSGTAHEEVDATFAHEELAIGFNGKYLADLLRATLPDGDIEIALADPGSPTIFRRPSATEDLCVLMPMRV
ncbi:MAG: polymerase beta subunit [Xanthobacteraceae bacterium]|jgi:DNA polymerase-3 subunit beta|nr:polymerase beta subunit [Xanthobacteraceae bacterium]